MNFLYRAGEKMTWTQAIVLCLAGALLVPTLLVGPSGPPGTATQTEPYVPVPPNWTAIAAWPPVEAAFISARPDPNRRVTAIVLDDSGSMGGDMEAAKASVVEALNAMSATDRVAVLGLNSGTILSFVDVAEARTALPLAIRPIESSGGTPLTPAMRAAQDLLEAEAAMARGFGTFRMIVTTDGVADEPDALRATVEDIARRTPIQITTIGIGIGGNHVLRRSALGQFVDISNVEAMGQALQAAVAENNDFIAITDFAETGD
ncbi:MAG: vWA domain-containing protein [Pseudomonadota bacterium]